MKKTKAIIAAGIIAMGALSINVMALGNQAGSSSDPVVTKSYVDKKISDALGKGSSGELSEYQMEFIISEIKQSLADELNGTGAIGDSYVPVNVEAGFILIGEEGTEIILRSGQAEGYTDGAEGVVNATTGEEVTNGTKINKNNLLIIPRSDGRGVKCATNSWFIIKGGYSIR